MNPLFWGMTCYLFLVTCYHQKSGHYLTEGQVLMDRHDSELLMEETECVPYERMKEIASGEENVSRALRSSSRSGDHGRELLG